MTIPAPTSFPDALGLLGAKRLAPTALHSAEIARMPAAIRERSIFSSGVQSTSFLQRVATGLESVMTGQSNLGDVRARIKALADGLTPEALRQDGRLNLILSTNLDMLHGFGLNQMTQNDAILQEWPCWEFYRAEARRVPRNWPERWAAAGGEFFPGVGFYPEGRMIALKNAPIWVEISRFGLPYAPFDYNSGMDLRDVGRDEAERLGLIRSDKDVPKAAPRTLNGELQASLEEIGDIGLQAALDHWLGGMQIAQLGADNVLRFLGAGGAN